MRACCCAFPLPWPWATGSARQKPASGAGARPPRGFAAGADAGALAWLGYYDSARSAIRARCPIPSIALRMPSSLLRWQPANHVAAYSTAELRLFYTKGEANDFFLLHSPHGVLPFTAAS